MAAHNDLIRAQSDGLTCASVGRAEFNFKRFAVGKDLNHCAELPAAEIVFRQVAGEGDYFKQFSVQALSPPVFRLVL
jgi:hypothetical protein